MMTVNGFGIGKCVVVECARLCAQNVRPGLVPSDDGKFAFVAYEVEDSSCKSIGTKNAVYVRMKNDEIRSTLLILCSSIGCKWLPEMPQNVTLRQWSWISMK